MSAFSAIPPLYAGDCLTRAEFERRYSAMPFLKKAEVLEGVVYFPKCAADYNQSECRFNLIGWLGIYRAPTPGLIGGANGSIRLDLDNEPQPDAYLRLLSSYGGRLVRVAQRSIRATAARQRWHLSQRGVSRLMARSKGDGCRRPRARQFRRPTRIGQSGVCGLCGSIATDRDPKAQLSLTKRHNLTRPPIAIQSLA